jgi:sugar phosphate isomerase/epimerase
MKIGAMNHPAKDPLAEIEWFGEQGFDFVDLTLEPPAADPSEVDSEKIQRLLAAHDLDVIAHTAYFLPISSPFEGVRKASLDELRRALVTAGEIGAVLMTVHYRQPPALFTDQDAVQWHLEVLGRLCDEADKMGVTIVLEHSPHCGENELENIIQIIDQLPLLGFHLDSGHAKLERGYDRFEEYLDRLGYPSVAV